MTLPAYLQNSNLPRLSDSIAGNLGTAAPPYLSIAGNRFTLIDADGAEEPVTTLDPKTGMFYLDAVIIDGLEIESKVYYGKAYDPSAGSFSPPDCWSDNGVAPSRNAGSPQSPTCAACPKAEWGSAVSKVSGKGVPACSKYQKIALLPVTLDAQNKIARVDDMAFLLRVPPNSLKNLGSYNNKFRGQEFDMRDVVTRITFIKDTLGTLAFSALLVIDEPAAKQRNSLLEGKKTDQIVGRGDLPREGLPHPTQAAQIEHQPSTAPVADTRTQTAPAPAAETPRRRRRTAAEIAAANEPASGQPAGVAPFRPDPAPNGGAALFGIQAGVAPNAELSAALDSIFK